MKQALRVLMVGATRKYAHLVVPELLKRGVTIHALVLDAETAKTLSGSTTGGEDWENSCSMRSAVPRQGTYLVLSRYNQSVCGAEYIKASRLS